MVSISTVLRAEIARVARKQNKEEIAGLRKSQASTRAQLTTYKRELKAITVELKALQRAVKKGGFGGPAETKSAPGPSRFRFSGERLQAQRERLGLTQIQMAELLSASSLSYRKWEKEAASPRGNNLKKIAVVMKYGKRQALAILGKGASL